MRDQRKVSDYLQPRPDMPAAPGRAHSPVNGSEAAAPAAPDETPPPDEEERRRLAELEELAGMLQKLHATMDTALNTVASAQQEYEAQDKPTEAPRKPAEMPPPRPPRLQAELKPGPGPKPAPAPEARWRRSIMLSGVGVSAGAVLLALLGWLWHANSVLDPESVESANPEGFISLDQDPLAARPSPQPSSGAVPRAEPGSFTKTNARAPMADTPESMETRAAPAATEEQPPRQALLADETLYGVAGEPVSLGIVLPEAAAAANISIAVEGVTAPATITGGTRLGGETWMVDARQATSAALLTPATYPGGTFRMNVRLVSNDGGITPARTLTVSLERSQAFAAAGADPGQEGAISQQQEPAPAESVPPAMIPASDETSPAVAAPAPPGTQIVAEAQPDQTQPPVQAGEKVAPGSQPGPARPALVGQSLPEPQQPADTVSDAAQPGAPAKTGQPRAEPTRSEPVTDHVNMRAEPSNDGEVVTVVPAGKSVGIIECGRHWCEVTYADKRGWIYKRFVGEGRASQRAAPAVLSSAERRPAANPQRPPQAAESEKPRKGFWKRILPF